MSNPSCERVLDVVGSPKLSPELLSHLSGCAFCRGARAAYEALEPAAAWVVDESRIDAIRQRALSELAQNPRARPWWVDAAALAVVNVAVAALGAVLLSRHDAAYVGVAALVAALLLGLLLFAAILAVAPGRRLGRNVALAVAGAAAVAVGLGGSGAGAATPFFAAGMPCMATELSLSFVPLAFALWLLTRSAFDVRRALLVGASGGATGIFALHLHCPIGTAAHLLAFHVAPWAVLTLAAVLIRRWLPTRSHAP